MVPHQQTRRGPRRRRSSRTGRPLLRRMSRNSANGCALRRKGMARSRRATPATRGGRVGGSMRKGTISSTTPLKYGWNATGSPTSAAVRHPIEFKRLPGRVPRCARAGLYSPVAFFFLSDRLPEPCHSQACDTARPLGDDPFCNRIAAVKPSLNFNTLCLEPDVVVIGAEHKRLIAEIEKRGGTVISVPFDKPSECGGGIRCSTHPLLREA
jgi:hypothetical protein